jgi:hypothetical protein
MQPQRAKRAMGKTGSRPLNMNPDQPSQDKRVEARAEEAAAIRRRWLTLGELLAMVAVLISALTLWLNWSERSDNQTRKTAEANQAATRAATLILSAHPTATGARLDLRPASSSQQILEQTVSFPAPLGIDPVETTGDARIEGRWFEDALKKIRGKAGLLDDSRGDERLPLLIRTRFLADGRSHEDVTLYDLGYTIKGRMLSGHVLTLRGLSLVKHLKPADAASELESRSSHLLAWPAR